jgi:hypothetical protein
MMMMSTALTLIIGNAEQLLCGDLDGRRCPVLHLRCLRHDDDAVTLIKLLQVICCRLNDCQLTIVRKLTIQKNNTKTVQDDASMLLPLPYSSGSTELLVGVRLCIAEDEHNNISFVVFMRRAEVHHWA